jgi:hypothetical protein
MHRLRSVHLPHLGHSVKLGRRRPVARGPRLKLRHYLKAGLPTPPKSFSYARSAARSLADVYLNAQYGCCVIAGGFHVRGVLSANAGKEIIYADKDVIRDYSVIGGFDPRNPDQTDNGCNEQDALNYWTETGFPDGGKLTAWLAVNPQDPEEYRLALWLFENLLYGSGLPDVWLADPRPGFVWDAAPEDPDNGHCFIACGADDGATQIDTWGMLGTLTEAAHAQDVDEMYVLLDQAMIAKGQQKAPNGFDWTQLVEDFDYLGGNVPVPAAA